MKLSKELIDMLNKQLNHERFNEAFYWSCASYFDSLNLENISTYFKLQAKEERKHAERFYDFIDENGAKVIIDSVPAPERNFKSFSQPFELAVLAEEKTSLLIRNLSIQASKENDIRSLRFLMTFEDEQQEEEDLWNYNLSRAKLAENDNAATLMLDAEMSQREANGNKKYKYID